MKKSLHFFKISSIMLVLVLIASVTQAQTRTASVSGNWNNVATWGSASVPTSANDVVINDGVTVTVNVAAACASLTINGGTSGGGITISTTNSLAVTNGAIINAPQNNNDVKSIAVGAGTFTCSSLTMADVVSGNINTDVVFSVSTGTATVSGTITMNGSTSENFVNITGAGILNLGDISPVNGTLAPSATSTVNYTGAGGTIRAITYQNLILSGSGAKTVTGVTVNGKLSMQGTATATGTSPTFGAASSLEYAGSAAQTTSSVEFPAAGGATRLIINNSNDVTLHAARTISTLLTLTNGLLNTTATNILNIADNATTTGASDNSFVNGPLSKTGNDAFTFPVGVAGAGLRTIGISAPGSTGSIFTAQFVRSDPHALSSTMGAGIEQISGCEYWTLSNTGTASNASVILSWASGSTCSGANYVGNTNTLRVGRLSAGTWVNEGRLSTTGSLTAGTITSAAAVTTFGTSFALATSAPDNALPVMFADVKAFEKNNGVQIDWSNLTERDLIRYIVERSVDGKNFAGIDQQLPRSNQNDKESYSSFDASPVAGANFYRIKVLEISGKIIYSKILKVEIGKTQGGFTLYPNPVSGNQVTVGLTTKEGQYTLRILNNAGQEVYTQQLIHQGGNMSQTVQLPASVKPGVYSIMISGDNYRESKMFVVQ
jgi:hypothetical protein